MTPETERAAEEAGAVDRAPSAPSATSCGPEVADRLADEIAECAALADAALHPTLTQLRKFLELELWSEHGALSPTHWCVWRLGWPPSTAKVKVRVARALGRLPRIDDAFRRGEISYAMVRALVRIATPENEELLLDYARHATASVMAKVVGGVVAMLKQAENPDLSHLLGLSFQNRGDGTVRLEATLLPEQSDTIQKAVELKLRRDEEAARADEMAPEGAAPEQAAEATDDEPPPPEDELAREEWARRRADATRRKAAERRQAQVDALAGICEQYIDANRPEKVIPGAVDALVIVDYETLAKADRFPFGRCELSDGTPLSPETARRLTCDAPYSVALVGPDGTPLDVGRRTRQISPALWKALVLRDRHCTFPGCQRAGWSLNAHHIQHWAQGGETNLDNLTLTCRAHHRCVHEGDYSVVRVDAQTVVWFDPWGRPLVDGSLRPAIEGDALERIRERARAMGIVLDKRAVREQMTGRGVDLSWTVGNILERTPGSGWFRRQQEAAAV